MAAKYHSIKMAAKRTGLSAHVIRIWEKRYGAVSPSRTKTNRRLYSEEEIERLDLLRQATKQGYSIGTIARLPNPELRALSHAGGASPSPVPQGAEGGADNLLSQAIDAIKATDVKALEQALSRGVTALGAHGLLHQLIAPLAQRVGDLWCEGVITAAHEHFATAVIRNLLASASRPFAPAENAPALVVVTPAGQLHELGAVMVAAAAADVGWRVIYLGSSLPAAEIAGVALHNRARAVLLSIVYPEDDPTLGGELERLRQYLPPEVKVIVGGRASGSYPEALHKIGAIRLDTLSQLYPVLQGLRGPASKP